MAIDARRATFDRTQLFTPWAYAMPRYKLVEHLRRSRVRASVSVDDCEELFEMDETEQAAAARDVDRLLSRLPRAMSEAIRLTRIEGHSIDDAAQRTGKTAAATKVSIHRGLGQGNSMQTTDLIDRLAADLRPIPQRAASQSLTVAVAIGSVVALGGALVSFGVPKDLASMLLTYSLWMKWAYAFAVSAAAFSLCARLARSEGAPGALPLMLGVPFLALGAIALVEVAGVPADARHGLWLGRTALTCPWIIAAFAIPIFAAALWALRRMAPTRQRLVGFSAGCLAGAAGAGLYAIHCNETAAAFVVSWYTVGILLPALVGMEGSAARRHPGLDRCARLGCRAGHL